MAIQWAYLTIVFCDDDDGQGSPDRMLQTQGDSGWELVAVSPLAEPGCYRYTFKQPK